MTFLLSTLKALEQANRLKYSILNGYTLCAVEQAQNSIMLDELQLDSKKKYAVVLGNEVKGVQQDVVSRCDCCVEIPQYGTKHSLNVSVAAGMVIWEFSKQLK